MKKNSEISISKKIWISTKLVYGCVCLPPGAGKVFCMLQNNMNNLVIKII